jgi:hypothetical protein
MRAAAAAAVFPDGNECIAAACLQSSGSDTLQGFDALKLQMKQPQQQQKVTARSGRVVRRNSRGSTLVCAQARI